MYGAAAAFFCLEPEPTQFSQGRSRPQGLRLPEPEPPKKVAAPQHRLCLSFVSFFLTLSQSVFMACMFLLAIHYLSRLCVLQFLSSFCSRISVFLFCCVHFSYHNLLPSLLFTPYFLLFSHPFLCVFFMSFFSMPYLSQPQYFLCLFVLLFLSKLLCFRTLFLLFSL